MFVWEKMGHIFNPASHRGSDWMVNFAQSPAAVILHDFVRVYFCTRPPSFGGPQISRIGYVDLDRRDLTKVIHVSKEPVLSLGEVGTFDEFGTNPVSAIKDGGDIRIYYSGWTRCESVPFNTCIGMAISDASGDIFTRVGKGPTLSYSLHEPLVIGSPRIKKFNNKWHLWYIAGKQWTIIKEHRPEPVYKIRHAESTDGINWVKQNEDLIENKLEENECQASPEVFYHNNRYHMFFSYRYNMDFKTPGRGYRIGYASSPNAKIWIRDDSQAGIVASESGWDSEISYPNIFELDGNWYMLYQGNEIGKNGFGLARMAKS